MTAHQREQLIDELVRRRPTSPSLECWFPHLIFRSVVGSQSQGLAGAGSDIDERSIFLPPAELHWSLEGVPPHVDDSSSETLYWEIGRFVELALKANPVAIEALFSPISAAIGEVGEQLVAIRGAFLSRRVFLSFRGSMESDLQSLEKLFTRDEHGKPKRAMHMIRRGLLGLSILETGEVSMNMDAHRDRLMAIREGRLNWSDVKRFALELVEHMDHAAHTTSLPDQPDREKVNAFLIAARRSAVRDELG